MALTEEQRKKIEQNRQEALRRRAEREKLKCATLGVNNNNVGSHGISQNFTRPNGQLLPSGPKTSSSQVKTVFFDKNNPIGSHQPTVPTVSTTVPSVPVKVAVKFTLKTADKFELSFPFNQAVVDVCRKISSANFDSKTRNWCFDLVQYRSLLAALHSLKQTHSITMDLLQGIPDFVIQALIKEQKRPKMDIDLSAVLPKRLFEALYPFQKDGVKFAISRDGRCLIGDDMGLGKTIQALATVYYFRDDWPLLIVCPSSLRFQWKRSILEWLDGVREDKDIDVILDGRKDIPVKKIVIISYDLLLKIKPNIATSFKSIILDESHYIKNDAAQRTKQALRLIKSCKRVILLSGTPALSRPMELFTQLQAVDSKTFSRKHDFGMRYCAGKATAWGYDYKGSSNSDELRILLQSTFLIRRLKIDVLQELPAKRRTVVALDLNLQPKAAELMDRFRNKVQIDATEAMNNAEQRSILFQWYSSTAEVKAEPVCRYVNELVEQDRKFICFGHHKVMLDAICSTLESQRTSYIRIDGSTPSECRQQCCDYFQTNDKCRVAVLAITSAGMGITLTAAQLVVFAELYYNPGVLTQAEDRAHRIGQKDSVLIQYLIASKTVDDHIWPLINSKFKVLNKVGLTKDNFSEANESRKVAKKQGKNLIDKYIRKRPRDGDESFSHEMDFDSFHDPQPSRVPTGADDSFQLDNLNEEILLTDDEEFAFDDEEFKFDDDLQLSDFDLKLTEPLNKMSQDQPQEYLLDANNFLTDDED